MKFNTKIKRDIRIDVLRTLAILLIVLAHVNPEQWVAQLRVFDVPLMTFLLGMSFVISSRKYNSISYLEYVTKRFERLVIPAWIFLTIFFGVVFSAEAILNVDVPYDLKTVVTSYSLISGIGFVWIIRVFFTIALFSPLLLWISNKFHSLLSRLGLIVFLLSIQEFLCAINTQLKGNIQTLFEHFIAISFGYLIVALIGMWAVKQTKNENFMLGLLSLLSFFVIAIFNNFPLTSQQKYPPTAYFLLYGVGISSILLAILTNKFVLQYFEKFSVVSWLSKHSLELYYWHIFPALAIQWVMPDLNWIIKYILVLVPSLIVTKIQVTYLPRVFQFDYLSKKFKVNRN